MAVRRAARQPGEKAKGKVMRWGDVPGQFALFEDVDPALLGEGVVGDGVDGGDGRSVA